MPGKAPDGVEREKAKRKSREEADRKTSSISIVSNLKQGGRGGS